MRAITALSLLAIPSTLCGADVILDRLGPTNQGLTSGRAQLEVSGLPTVIGTQKMVAIPVQVTGSDYFLTSVESSFSRGNSSSPEVTFELWGTHPSTGNPDRDQILEISPTRLVVPGGTTVVAAEFTFSGATRLSAGVQYWIVARKQLGPGSVFMTENAVGNRDPWAYTSNGFLNGVALTGPTFFDGPAIRVNATPASCPADFNHDGQADFFDYLDFVAAFDISDPSADFNGDNQVDFFDYLDFAVAFDAGCP
jgi:hypothetical protein